MLELAKLIGLLSALVYVRSPNSPITSLFSWLTIVVWRSFQVSITDLFAGFNAFGAILAAVIKRTRTGKGTYIDVSMFDSQAAVMSTVASNWLNAGKEVQRVGTAHASVVPYQAFPTEDGFIMIACGNDRQVSRYRN
jgi:crotonobetainyl-CoA:carnitine CoA-transferase CaiB-like acyl-CoA transferase